MMYVSINKHKLLACFTSTFHGMLRNNVNIAFLLIHFISIFLEVQKIENKKVENALIEKCNAFIIFAY